MQQQGLKLRSDLHLSRKLYHCVGISLMAALYNLFGHKVSAIAIIGISAVYIPGDYFRQTRPKLNAFIVKILGPVMRQHEYKSISGTSYLLVGAMFLLLFKDRHIVTLTLLFLAFGDPIASFCGIRYGKDKILGYKTLQGTMAAFAVCAVIAAIYYYFNNLMTERLLIVSPISGLIGALSELLPIGKLDDNLTFPILCSILLWTLFKVYGGFGL
jgi:diacylglycerol kinase (CTP)